VNLLGIIKTPPEENLSRHPISLIRPETFFLVLEFAREGRLIDYLARVLTGETSDWKTIFRCISSLCHGVRELHRHGVIHRYAGYM
jgi:hypothetical protein